MATEVKRRRGTTDQHNGTNGETGFTGAVAELTVDLTKDTVVVHDGATQGGFPLLREDLSNVPTTAPFTHITLDTAIFDTAYTETESETQGTLYWNSDEETLSLVTNGSTLELGHKTELHVKVTQTGGVSRGDVVAATGAVGGSGKIEVQKFSAGTSPTKTIVGIMDEDVAQGEFGKAIAFGKIRGLNMSAFSEGDILYASTTAGELTGTEPTAGNVSLPIAYVVDNSVNTGEIFVRITPIDENAYQDYDAGLADIAGLTPSDGNFIVGDGTNWVAESGATALASLGAQAQDPQLDDIAGLTPTDGNFIVGNGSNFVAESGNTARTSLGLGTSDDVQFDDLTLTGVLRTNEIDAQADLVWDDTNNTEVWNTSDYYINGAINIASNVYITDQLDVGESLTVGTTLDVTGDTTLDGTLTLSGSADFNSTMNLQGDLTTQANLQDDGYATGWSGTNWQIQADGSAEFEELRVRGALRVFEFIAKQISTIGGSEILSIAQGRVVSTSASTITLENVTGTPGNSFKANDLWICQVTDINNDLESGGTGSVVKSVRGTVTLVSGNAIIVSVESGSLDDLSQGDLIVAYGNTVDADRQAIMYRNVDRSEDNLIMRLQTEVNEFADLQAVGNTRVAFGDLNGYSELSSETFGFFAGKNAEGHILATNAGLFLKDGTNTLAEITSNTFKVGDSTNFLSFNGSAFDIQTNTFDLTAGSMTIDSTDGITIGTNDFFKQDKTFSFGGGVLSGDSDTVLITTTNFNVNTDNQNIVIGTGSALMTVGKLSSVEQGIKIDSNGITNQNYWKLGQGDVQFKVGDGTNFLSFNENAGTFEIKSETFDLTAGNLRIKSAGTTFPSADTGNTSSDAGGLLAHGGTFTKLDLTINDSKYIKFQFDYSFTRTASEMTPNLEVEILEKVSGSFGSISLFNYDNSYFLNSNYVKVVASTGPALNVTNLSDNNKLALKFSNTNDSNFIGVITFYVQVTTKGTATALALKFTDSTTNTSGQVNITDIDGVEYNAVSELNPNGIFTRLSDSLILSNGTTLFNPNLVTNV